jgi:hypothetical protein
MESNPSIPAIGSRPASGFEPALAIPASIFFAIFAFFCDYSRSVGRRYLILPFLCLLRLFPFLSYPLHALGYSALIQLSDPVTFTDTSVKKR